MIGKADLDALDDVAGQARQALHRDVSIHCIGVEPWAAGTDQFVATVRSQPLVPLSKVTAGPATPGDQALDG